MIVTYPVKIHFNGCSCKFYKNKVKRENEILVAPYRKEDIKKRYYCYETIEQLLRDKKLYPDNCLCTHSTGVYNGGIVLLSESCLEKYCLTESDELVEIEFKKLVDIKNLPDNSNLINVFCTLFPSIDNYYVLIGKTRDAKEKNYTFPKGKINIDDSIDKRNKTIVLRGSNPAEECCFREFEEEIGMSIKNSSSECVNQIQIRKDMNLNFLPHRVIINNFLLKIIII